MNTTIKVELKRGNYKKTLTETINEVSEKLTKFISEKKLHEKRIEFQGKESTNKTLKVKYKFVDEDPKKFKGIGPGRTIWKKELNKKGANSESNKKAGAGN
jgi:hypothetical protein